jgi:hypothetical protein
MHREARPLGMIAAGGVHQQHVGARRESQDGGLEQRAVAHAEQARDVRCRREAPRDRDLDGSVVEDHGSRCPALVARGTRTDTAAGEADEAAPDGSRAVPWPPRLGTQRRQRPLGGDQRFCGRGPCGGHAVHADDAGNPVEPAGRFRTPPLRRTAPAR